MADWTTRHIVMAALIGGLIAAPAQAQSFWDKLNPFSSGPAPSTPGTMPVDPDDIDCPSVDIRVGASTYAVGVSGREASGNDLRYQATIGRMARECRVSAGTMFMRVGVQGRLIVGPAGGPGRIDVPFRLAVVKEGPEPKTVFTRFIRIPAGVEPGQPSAAFTQVFDDVSFPLPPDGDLEAYIVYVGFDPKGEAPAAKAAPKKAKKSAHPVTQ